MVITLLHNEYVRCIVAIIRRGNRGAIAQVVTLVVMASVLAIEGSSVLAQAPYRIVNRLSTGRRPLGITAYTPTRGETFVAVANSGDQTVSVYQLGQSATAESYTLVPVSRPPLQPQYSVPSPFAVLSCRGFLITSSAGTTITQVGFQVDLLGTIAGYSFRSHVVGPRPQAAFCEAGSNTALVSTLGDSSLSRVNLETGEVAFRISNVPASRGLHGIAIDSAGNAWVAGTEANVVTEVSLRTQSVLTTISSPSPIGVGVLENLIYVASENDQTIRVIDTNTLQLRQTIPVSGRIEDFVPVISTGEDSVKFYSPSGQPAEIVTGIPGASGVSLATLLAAGVGGVLVASRDSDSLFLLRSLPPPAAFEIRNAASFDAGGRGRLIQ